MNLNLPFNLAKLSKTELLQKTKILVSEERRITTEILWCLHEVERRMLYAELGYSSIYEFAGKYLGYSGGSAHRRISAMRLLKGLPAEVREQAEEKIKTGELTLTNVSLLHDFLKAEKKESQKTYTVTEKQSLLNSIENQSKRTVEKKLAAIQPAILPKEKERVITESLTQISFVADDKLLKKLNRIKELKGQALSYPELLNEMAELMLERIDPDRKIQRKIERKEQSEKGMSLKSNSTVSQNSTPPASWKKSRCIPAPIKQEVWLRDKGVCTYKDPITYKKCESKFGLEYDHIQAFAKNGEHSVENLRLRCRTHNQLHAVQVYGQEKMQKWIK